jgi:CBS domain containing-hemolysin-like protein
MNAGDIISWGVLVLCLLMSFLMSGMEAGVFAVSRLHVRRLARSGKPSARLLHGFLERPENFLWTIMVGNTLANFLILGFTFVKIHDWLLGDRVRVSVVFAAVVFLFYALFDLFPKMFFRAHPTQLCLSVAPVFRFVHFVLSPIVSIVEGLSEIALRLTGGRAFTGRLFGSREEMRSFMQDSAQSLTSDERAMINRVLDLQNITVRLIATPLAQTVTVEAQTPLGDAFRLGRERKLWRLPVREIRDGRQRIAGLLALGPLLFRDDLDLQKPAGAYIKPALFVNENMRLEVALRLMQRAGHRLAIVLARNGAETGIVSLEDILKVMFGEVKL